MTPDVARKRPANLPTVLVLDEMHQLQTANEAKALLTAMQAEMRKRELVLAEPTPPQADPSVKVLLRVISLLFLAGAGFMVWAELTGYHL